MKKILILLFIVYICGLPVALAQIAPQHGSISRYEQIYNNIPELNLSFENEEDPMEYTDYKDFEASPYPLIRISSPLRFKSIKIQTGYYLLVPRSDGNSNYVIFKQKGKIVAIIPAYQKIRIDPKVFYKEPPKPKTPWWKLPFVGVKKGFLKLLGKHKKPPSPPKSALEASTIDINYYEITLYYKDSGYKMLFKNEK